MRKEEEREEKWKKKRTENEKINVHDIHLLKNKCEHGN